MIAIAVVLAAAAAPVIAIEGGCRVRASPGPERASLLDPRFRRPEAKSVLAYPEWHIVYAYQDFAAVLARADEHAFDYLAAIWGYWRSFCAATRFVTGRGGDAADQRTSLYVIGLSFTAEMAAKGVYESTVGALTAWWRGPERTPEDRFAQALAADYGAFLVQTPWYEYPFFAATFRLWREAPFGAASAVRAVERRLALSLENLAKGAYGAAIGAASGAAYGAEELTIRSVVTGLDAADLAAEPRIRLVSDGPAGAVIETPRYRAFTEVLRGLAARGRDLVEIAGNDLVLLTVLTRSPAVGQGLGLREIFSVPVQARPGWRRAALVAPVPELLRALRELPAGGHEVEHVYDY